jgi:hypothetical protein
MAVTHVQPLEADGSAAETNEYTVVYQVITDDVNDGPLTATTASGIPSRGSFYQFGNEADYWAFAESARAKLVSRDNSRKVWNVTITYRHPSDTQQQNDAPNASAADPLDIGWKISGSFANQQLPAEVDSTGAAVTNSVEEPFIDPPLMYDAPIDTLILEKNTATINLATRAACIGTVNSAEMWGLKKRQIKLARWDYRILYYGNGSSYVSNTFEFQIRSTISEINGAEIGWTDEVLDKGSRFIVNQFAADPRVRYANITDENGRFLVEKLDGQGNVLPVGDPLAWLQFKIELEYDFLALGIPDPLPGPFILT